MAKNIKKKLVEEIFSRISKKTCSNYPSRDQIARLCKSLYTMLFPQVSEKCLKNVHDLDVFIDEVCLQIKASLHHFVQEKSADDIIEEFRFELPHILHLLDTDVSAALNGDPAAKSAEEIILCYPGFFAIAIHRIAHFFYSKNVLVFPRILSEYAHQTTGIDIHPGAQIGKYFFIDHGTGVVIGETTIIGDNVKIYQGVTLGALSVKKKLAGTKRHPTVENDCVIYSNATVLGGETILGAGSVVGGNVWLTKSLKPRSVCYNTSKIKLVKNNEI